MFKLNSASVTMLAATVLACVCVVCWSSCTATRPEKALTFADTTKAAHAIGHNANDVRQALLGKTTDDVRSLLGEPIQIYTKDPLREGWVYQRICFDEEQRCWLNAHVFFHDGVVESLFLSRET